MLLARILDDEGPGVRDVRHDHGELHRRRWEPESVFRLPGASAVVPQELGGLQLLDHAVNHWAFAAALVTIQAGASI